MLVFQSLNIELKFLGVPEPSPTLMRFIFPPRVLGNQNISICCGFFVLLLIFSYVFFVWQRSPNNTLKRQFNLTQQMSIFSTIFGRHSFPYFSVFTIWWSRWWQNLFSLHFFGYFKCQLYFCGSLPYCRCFLSLLLLFYFCLI